jgi:hypothetical protein
MYMSTHFFASKHVFIFNRRSEITVKIIVKIILKFCNTEPLHTLLKKKKVFTCIFKWLYITPFEHNPKNYFNSIIINFLLITERRCKNIINCIPLSYTSMPVAHEHTVINTEMYILP